MQLVHFRASFVSRPMEMQCCAMWRNKRVAVQFSHQVQQVQQEPSRCDRASWHQKKKTEEAKMQGGQVRAHFLRHVPQPCTNPPGQHAEPLLVMFRLVSARKVHTLCYFGNKKGLQHAAPAAGQDTKKPWPAAPAAGQETKCTVGPKMYGAQAVQQKARFLD